MGREFLSVVCDTAWAPGTCGKWSKQHRAIYNCKYYVNAVLFRLTEYENRRGDVRKSEPCRSHPAVRTLNIQLIVFEAPSVCNVLGPGQL